MDATYRTPIWLSALLATVITACVVVFGLLLIQHARKAALEEQLQSLRVEVVGLRALDGALRTEIGQDGPLAKQVQKRAKFLEEVSKESTDAVNDTKMLVDKGTENATAIKDGMDKATGTRKTLEQEAKDRRAELAQVETQLVANERDFENNLGKLREQIATVSREVEAVRKKNLQESAERNLRITELQERITELTRQREIANRDAKADGKIMEADSTVGFVVIDLGRQQALRKGTKFTVYNRQAGRNVFKGMIEVTDVQERISTCRVLEEKDANNPLVPNDLITNPVFDPAKVKGFAIRGAFRRFSKDELKRFILESGGRYDEDPGVSTDYLVAGENAEDFLLQANKLGITILSEEQLIESQLFRLPVGKAENK
jgi:NAD-dependent DNA ligase